MPKVVPSPGIRRSRPAYRPCARGRRSRGHREDCDWRLHANDDDEVGDAPLTGAAGWAGERRDVDGGGPGSRDETIEGDMPISQFFREQSGHALATG